MATTRINERRHAIVREIPDSYTSALANFFGGGPTDIRLARRQHEAYIGALKSQGIDVIVLPKDEAHPDCPFVEDQAIVIGNRCLLPIVGHQSRQGELPIIEIELSKHLSIKKMKAPAKLDGGDVVRIGDDFFVGNSTRTNEEGISTLRNFVESSGYTLTEVTIPNNALHLTSVCSSPTPDMLLLTEDTVPISHFGDLNGVDVELIPLSEIRGVNVIGFENTAFVAEGAPTVRKIMEKRGFEIISLDISQISAADASLTCMSVFFP